MILRLQHQRPDGEVDNYYLKPGRRYHVGRGSGCEVRILDLKLSRKHCAFEFINDTWNIIDLLSTNGCMLNGEQIVGTIPVKKSNTVSAGATTLTIDDIFDMATAPNQGTSSKGNESAGDADTEAVTPEIGGEDDNVEVLEQEPLPEGEINLAEKTAALRRNEWEPEPGSDAFTKTDALVPRPGAKPKTSSKPLTGEEPRRPTAVFRASDPSVDIDHDSEATKMHVPTISDQESKPPAPSTSPAPSTDSHERTFFITVMGRRVGPLTRSAARELKARELKGTLTTAELEQYPQG